MNEQQQKEQYQKAYIQSQINTGSEELKEKPYSELEQLYSSLQKKVTRTDNEVTEIYHLIDKLFGIPVNDEILDRPATDSNKIIPKFQEEVLKLHEVNHILETLRTHLQHIIG